jgi:hypothetical protein
MPFVHSLLGRFLLRWFESYSGSREKPEPIAHFVGGNGGVNCGKNRFCSKAYAIMPCGHAVICCHARVLALPRHRSSHNDIRWSTYVNLV